MVTRQQVVQEARSWIGVPFRHMGRSRQAGVDCIGFVLCVAWALEIPLVDYKGNYTRRGQGFEMVRHIIRTGSENVRLGDAGDGDVMAFAEAGIPCHVGILTTRNGQRYVVQALGKTSWMKVFETPLAGELAGNARYAFRMPGVEG